MTLALTLKLLHIFASIWMIAGIIGRYVTLQKAEQSTDMHAVSVLIPVAGIFERVMVRPGSMAVLLAGLVTAWAQGWPILGFIQGGASNWVLVSLLLFLTMIPLIGLIFLPRGRIFEAAFTNAVKVDRVTPELQAAFHDPLVRAGHIYEIAAIAVITTLMVFKPF